MYRNRKEIEVAKIDMDAILHKAATRGHTANSWLETWHSFSFGNYHDATRMHFGALRVLVTALIGASIGAIVARWLTSTID